MTIKLKLTIITAISLLPWVLLLSCHVYHVVKYPLIVTVDNGGSTFTISGCAPNYKIYGLEITQDNRARWIEKKDSK